MITHPGLVTLLSPVAARSEAGPDIAARLAGNQDVLALEDHGARNLGRRQTPAEIHALRRLIQHAGDTVGLVVAGRFIAPMQHGEDGEVRTPGPGPEAGSAGSDRGFTRGPTAERGAPASDSPVGIPGPVLVVTDHIALAVESPLVGPNDPSVGPRFPVTAGLYRPDLAVRLAAGHPAGGADAGAVLPSGVVVCVRETGALTPLEGELLEAGRAGAASAELAPVALLAAHLGRVVAAILVEEPEGGGR